MKQYLAALSMTVAFAAQADTRALTLPGNGGADSAWTPALHLQVQTARPGARPVLYVHGATFPAANSIMFKFNGESWADALNKDGYSVWGFDFAGFGASERYPGMADVAPSPGDPLGRAPEAARQIERVVRAIIAETGTQRVSIIAHSWGTIATGLFATQHPELVERLVFFAPIVRRETVKAVSAPGNWRFLSVAEQHRRFVEDVPAGHPPVLAENDFPAWAERYLDSDPTSRTRTPHSVKTPNGPVADIMDAWSGRLAYDPALITVPVAIVRGEWDSLCIDSDVAWLLAQLTGAPDKQDIKIPNGTHLMHLETGRHALYRAASAFLRKE
jgi:pimeloyl-ACP methyl ester carboxylesterase